MSDSPQQDQDALPATGRKPRLAGVLWLLPAFVFVGLMVMNRSDDTTDFSNSRSGSDAPEAATFQPADASPMQLLARLESHPDDHEVRLLLGQKLKSTDAETALKQLQVIPASAPQYNAAQKDIAHILLTAGREAEAITVLQQLCESDFENEALHYGIAELCINAEDYRAALRHVQSLVELKPDTSKYHVMLAEIYDELGRVHDMAAPLQKAIDAEPESWDARVLLAYAMVSTGQMEEANESVQWCLAQRPDDVTTRRLNAIVLRWEGKHQAALDEVRAVLDHEPDNVELRLIEADLLLYQRDAEGAYAALVPFSESSSDSRDFLGTLLRAAALTGRKEEAVRIRKQLSKLMARDDEAIRSTTK